MELQNLKRKIRTTYGRRDQTQAIALRVEPLLAEVLQEIADENGISRNMLLTAILNEFVENYTTK